LKVFTLGNSALGMQGFVTNREQEEEEEEEQ
jgi:hypothetical protein